MDCNPKQTKQTKQIEKDFKKLIPEYDGSLESIKKELNGQYLYIKKD